jgi:endonuclease/exonuclease/phosphatase family metal-dependent hydrolase
LFVRARLATAISFLACSVLSAETFRVATYNVENYIDRPTQTRRQVKSDAARAKIRQSIRTIKPEVIAFQEMGEWTALMELRDSLKAEGLDYPYWEHISGWDTNIHVALLSKFIITDRRPHTNETFLLDGKRFRISRGFAEVDIKVTSDYTFTLISGHLKSRRPVPEANEAELRLEEAKLLRGIIDKRLQAKPNANVVVLGDFNDTHDTATVKTIVGKGGLKLTDTRPAERNGDTAPNPPVSDTETRNITWTYYYGVEDSYSRVDYIMLSPGMARKWVPGGTYILAIPNWGVGSDHRPLVATFNTEQQ